MATDHPDEVPITVYSLQTCPHCKAAKNFLSDQQITFRVVYVDMLTGEERNTTLRKLKRLNPAGSFPTIVIDGKTLVGFREEQLSQALSNLLSKV